MNIQLIRESFDKIFFASFLGVINDLPNIGADLVLTINNSPCIFLKNKKRLSVIIPKLLKEFIEWNAESYFFFHFIDHQYRFPHIIFAVIKAKKIKVIQCVEILREL
jgi:hypothetical protein